MFKKWGTDTDDLNSGDNGDTGIDVKEPVQNESEKISHSKPLYKKPVSGDINNILKGSKLTGDINVTCDLKLSGDVEGNITSEQNSNIVILGICKGNISTREGSIDIEGELQGGDMTAGRDIQIKGKFRGGEAKANGKIYINGEFNGKLEGNEIEIGPSASGKGELFYREYISIAKGAKVDVQISRSQKELKVAHNSPAKKVVDIKSQTKEVKEVKETKDINDKN